MPANSTVSIVAFSAAKKTFIAPVYCSAISIISNNLISTNNIGLPTYQGVILHPAVFLDSLPLIGCLCLSG